MVHLILKSKVALPLLVVFPASIAHDRAGIACHYGRTANRLVTRRFVGCTCSRRNLKKTKLFGLGQRILPPTRHSARPGIY
jgi:hypothetical protein